MKNMIDDIRYNFVNWKTGMQVSVNHFLDLEKAIVDRLRDIMAVRITSYNFGILTFSKQMDEVLDVEIAYSNDATVRIDLKRCKAITRAGNRIEITSHNTGNKLKTLFNVNSLDRTSSTYYLLVGIQPFEAKEFGESDPNEPFDRPPYRVPQYDVKMVQESEMFQVDHHRNYLPVKRFELKDQRLIEDVDYVAPSVSMYSSEILLQKHKQFLKTVRKIHTSTIKVIQLVKIQHKEYDPKKQGADYDLANFFSELSKQINNYIAVHLADLENVYPEAPPVYTINFFRQLAGITQAIINQSLDNDAQEVYKYIKHITDLDRGKIEDDLSTLILKKYDHFNIRESITSVENYLNTINTILTKLEKLNYIGYKQEKKDRLVIGERANEKDIQEKNKGNRGRFIIGNPS